MDSRIEEAQELVTSLKTKCQLRQEKLSRKMKQQQQQEGAPAGNNNEEDYQNNYTTEQEMCRPSGRSSTNSGSAFHESAFSSGSSEGEESETSYEERNSPVSSSTSSSSGRSSAEQSSSSTDLSVRQLNSVRNLTPATPKAHDIAEQIRQRFLASLLTDANDKYEQADLSEMERGFGELELSQLDQALSFRLISRFVNFNELTKLQQDERKDSRAALEKALGEATEKLRELLQFRCHYQLERVLFDHFCKEIYQLHGIFPFGVDRNQLPVLYLRARVHRRWSHELDEAFRRYVAWQVNLITKSYAGAQVASSIGRNGIEKDGSFGICFDCLNVSYSCVDMDFLSYLVKILVNYYPTYCRYALCVDLPWLFRSVWKLVRSWLPEEARNTVQLITSKQLVEFIDEGQIPNSIRIDERPAHDKPKSNRHQVPENLDAVRDFQQMAKDLKLSSNEVKQFRSHCEKVFKEYEQLGAM